MLLNFELDIERDFENYYENANESEDHFSAQLCARCFPNYILKMIQGVSKEEARKNFFPLLQENYKKYASYLNQFLLDAKKSWEENEQNYLKRLEKITGKKFPFNKITVYLTTILICSYNVEEKWFHTSFLNQPLLSTHVCAHELMHFHFHFHYEKWIKEEIGEKKKEDLKEALTVLLNLEFGDMFFISFRDGGFPGHEKLREFITKRWKDHKNFDKLLKECVLYLKES
ncbi:MAG: hypothetical protein KJ879_01665 [Nanoarchaeota archaeon]|nr:hypothetical protein [Nanoarchaeota archaeon]